MKLLFYSQCSSPAEIRLEYTYRHKVDFSESLKIARQADAVVFCAGLDGSIELEVRDRQSKEERPQKELKGFEKIYLVPGRIQDCPDCVG